MSCFAKILSFILIAVCLGAGESHALTLGQVAQIAQTAQPGAFNTVEMAVPNGQSRVPQWNRVKNALVIDAAVMQSCLEAVSNCTSTAMAQWRQMVLSVRGQGEAQKLIATNDFFNRWQYVSDQQNYGVSDYWASPVEFMKNGGDCEDYAIAKYVTMKFLGYDDRQLRIMAVIDNGRGGIGHAVLSVATQEGTMILDNQSSQIYSQEQQTAYAPRFAVNETNVYTYASQPQVMVASAAY